MYLDCDGGGGDGDAVEKLESVQMLTLADNKSSAIYAKIHFQE